jgi:hypothetical protein
MRMAPRITRRTFLTGSVALPAASLLGCGGGGGAAAVRNDVRVWTDLTHAGVSTSKLYPPAVARAHAIVATAMFDAWAAYDAVAVGTRLGGTLRRPLLERTLENKRKAIGFAAYRTLLDLFPTLLADLNARMSMLGYDFTDVSTDTSTPSGIGNLVAGALLTYRHTDGSNQLGDLHPGAYSDYSGYVPKNDADNILEPDHWQPLRVSDGAGGTVVQKYASASWGNVKPFALTMGSQFRPSKVLSKYGSPEYRAKCQQVIDASANLTDAQKLQAETWADGPGTYQPPGHWMAFADWLSARDHNDLDHDVKLFFLVANAVFDAGIACWDAKRVYDSVRPLTAIHYAFKGQLIRAWGGPFAGTVSMPGENFGTFQTPTFVTPPFPGYPSGHSTFSAAAAEALKRFYGSDHFGYALNFSGGSSTLEPGAVPAQNLRIPFATFTDAANSAANSRLWGGIHFAEDNADGLAIGRLVGAAVHNKVMAHIAGSP